LDVRFVDAGANRVAVLTLDRPPVNAMSFAYSAEIVEALATVERDEACSALVICGAGGTFSAGADVGDFAAPPVGRPISVRDVVAAIDRSARVTIAAIDGACLGGGLELALACDYRIASERSTFALPEVRLGLLPGAGGTQRLPRAIGPQAALEFALRGRTHDARACMKLGIVDRVVGESPDDVALALLTKGEVQKRRLADVAASLGPSVPEQALPFVTATAHKALPPEERGGRAAHAIVDAVAAAVTMPFDEGLAHEARLFEELAASSESVALRHLFFAERRLTDVPGLDGAQARPVQRAGVLGAGTMGSGIALALAQAGYAVTVVDPDDGAVERARRTVMETLAYRVRKGNLAQKDAWQMGRSIAFEAGVDALQTSDLVIEAIVERMDAKLDAFRKLDGIVAPDAVLATNTSTLDVDELASAVSRPERFVGLHFFVPANIMPLLEIVRGERTSAATLATAFALAKRLRKKPVVSGNAFGFIGNRMIFDYVREAIALAEEGAGVARIDRVMTDFGFAMGPFAMSDLSGIDVAWHIANTGRDRKRRPAIIGTIPVSATVVRRSTIRRSKRCSQKKPTGPA